MNSAIQTIPDTLVYEMQNGEPVYYAGYRDYLNGIKPIEEIRTSSLIQSMIISRLMFILQLNLSDEYEVLTNELGIQFEKKAWRAADMAIVKTADIEQVETKNKYLRFAPEIVIEIDTKAELSDLKNPLNYYQEKTDELLAFGIKKVVWIFSETEKVMVARAGEKWEISNWTEDIEIMDDVVVNITKLLKKRK